MKNNIRVERAIKNITQGDLAGKVGSIAANHQYH